MEYINEKDLNFDEAEKFEKSLVQRLTGIYLTETPVTDAIGDQISKVNYKNYPRSTVHDYYTDTCTHIRNIKDLRSLIENLDDDLPVYFFMSGTVYYIEGEVKTQECIEHSGFGHEKTGLIIQLEG